MGKFLPTMEGIVVNAAKTNPIKISFDVDDEVTYVSETRLTDSLPVIMPHDSPSKTIVVSLEVNKDNARIYTWRERKRGAMDTIASCTPKKKKISPSTITRHWQVV